MQIINSNTGKKKRNLNEEEKDFVEYDCVQCLSLPRHDLSIEDEYDELSFAEKCEVGIMLIRGLCQ